MQEDRVYHNSRPRNGLDVPITLTDFLNWNNITLEDVVAIHVLETGDIIVFV
jgi:hypothetical protein